MKVSLINISDKLMTLADDYTRIQPQFYLAELNYINTKAKLLMSQNIVGLASQSLRDAETDRLLALSPEYETYHKLKPEIDVINRLTWIYTELAKNTRAASWEGNS